jgi:DNA-binding transcriptional ArsR family regulator
MDVTGRLSKAAGLIGHPSRAAMLWTLMGGESRPASGLALVANVSPQTASNHLRLLRDAGFLKVSVVGRNRLYSLGGPHVAAAMEALAGAIQRLPSSGGAAHEQTPELVFARTCYDHLAGELGVAMMNGLRCSGYLREQGEDFRLTREGDRFLRAAGIDIAGAAGGRRRFAYACLDWTHRVPHLGGALGAAILDWLLRSGAVVRLKTGRAVRLTDVGRRQMQRVFGISLSLGGRALASRSRSAAVLGE